MCVFLILSLTVTGVLCQWANQQIVVMQGETEATVGETSLNLTCSYEATQMRFLQITPSKVTWRKIQHGQETTIYTIDLQGFRPSSGNFEGDWSKRGVVVSGGDLQTDIQLPAIVLKPTDGGEYECDLEDTNNRHYTNITSVIVYYGPGDDIIIHDDGTQFQVVEGQNLTLVCEANCYPDCNYTWFAGSTQLVSRGGQYYIDKCNRSDAGNYTCVAANGVGNGSAEVEVVVFYGAGHHVWFNPPAVYQNITEGQPFTFSCLAQCRPACDLFWDKGSHRLPSQGGSVQLVNASRTDSGMYTCHAINRVTNESRLYELDVQYGPGTSVVITPSGPTHVILEGGAVNLTCRAICHPSCSYSWVKDGRVVESGRVLSLQYVQRTQAGQYACRAGNGVGSSEARAKLDVHFQPQINSLTINQGDTTVNEGEKALFTCQVDGNPIPRVTWTNLNTQTIVKQEDTTRESVYVIPKASYLDAAVYRCEADNGIGLAADSQIQIYIACTPRLNPNVISQPSVLAKTGSDAVLSVTVIAYPGPSFTWYQSLGFGVQKLKGPRYKVTSNATSSTLTVSGVVLKDYGNYSVNVTNTRGAYIGTFQLQRADSPETPDSFYCTNHTDRSVELHWVSRDDNGAVQEFSLQYAPPGGKMSNKTGSVADPGEGLDVYANVTDLTPYTMYRFFLIATNKFGQSESVPTTCFTARQPDDTTVSHSLSFLQGIGAGVGITILLLVVGFFIVYIARSRYARYRNYNTPKENPIWRPHVDNRRSDAWNNRNNHGNNDIPVATFKPLINKYSTSPDKNIWRKMKNECV